MRLRRLEITQFRCFPSAVFEPAPDGLTVLTGANGTGKTSILEAIGVLGSQRSFRGAPSELLVRAGEDTAILRAILDESADDPASTLVEMELNRTGRGRAQINRQRVRRRPQLAAAVPTTVFFPNDLSLVQGGPAHRRELLDHALALVGSDGAVHAAQVERVVRQRNALLRQSPRHPGAEVLATLDVWDERLAAAGEGLRAARAELLARVTPIVQAAHGALAGADGAGEGSAADDPGPAAPGTLSLTLRSTWDDDLLAALKASRKEDLRRATTSVGPHRDEVEILLSGRDARQQASQGEQRCVALALRLGVHRLVTKVTGSPPILLLDDVFSELDAGRARALLIGIPRGQALLTTASPLPAHLGPADVVEVVTLAQAS